MPTRTKRPVRAKAPAQDKKEQPAVSVNGIDGEALVGQLDRRIKASQDHWKGEGFKIEQTSKDNEKWYLGNQDPDVEDDPDKTLDNRIFSSIRTVVPVVTNRVTEPEVYPSSNSKEAKSFADDFEKALHIKAKQEKVNMKLKFAAQDALIKRRGYLKLRYDAATNNFCSVEYVPPESIIVDHKAKSYEELKHFRHLLDTNINDLIVRFPDREDAIYQAFKLNKDTCGDEEREKDRTVNEDWAFVRGDDGQVDLVVCWHVNSMPFKAIKDPNWRYDASNFLPHHMMPLIDLNVLADGSGHIDKTSYVEQAKYLQRTLDQRIEQIGKNAGLGSIGMPVVDSEALDEESTELLTFDPELAIELDVPDGKNINDVFTQWKAGSLSPDVYKDKIDAIAAIQNAFGASAVLQGAESGNNTLGQDQLLRDQSVGRLQEIIDAIDTAMGRLYPLMAQMMLVYADEEMMFRYVGENSQFDYVMVTDKTLDTNAEIRVKSGTSMPIDNIQRRAVADKAAAQKNIDPLSYWEIMDEPNAQKYAKRLVEFSADPLKYLADASDEVFDRDAFTDIQILKQGGTPPYRDNLTKNYFDHLNKYVLSGDLENPRISNVAEQIKAFIDVQLQRGQKMLGMAETQLPTPEDVQAHNEQVDATNQTENAAMPVPGKGGPSIPMKPPAPVGA